MNKLLSILLITAFVLGSAGCNGPTAPAPTATAALATDAPTATPQPASGAVEITFWEQDLEDRFLDQRIAEFEAANPGIQVVRVHHNDAPADYLEALTAGEAPDVLRAPSELAGALMAPDKLTPANELFETGFFYQFFEGARADASRENALRSARALTAVQSSAVPWSAIPGDRTAFKAP
jgi:ABC-type glycerol-3-phosphate transport system substrate-binding protein